MLHATFSSINSNSILTIYLQVCLFLILGNTRIISLIISWGKRYSTTKDYNRQTGTVRQMNNPLLVNFICWETISNLYRPCKPSLGSNWRSHKKVKKFFFPQRNWLFATDSDFLISISLQPINVDLKYFKLWMLLDQIM